MIDAWDQNLRQRFPSYQDALDRIAELEGLFDRESKQDLPPNVFGMSKTTTKVTHAIAKRGRISHEGLETLVWGSAHDHDTDRLGKVFIVKARRALAPHGITIETVYGFGYEMSRESRELWFSAVEAEREKVSPR